MTYPELPIVEAHLIAVSAALRRAGIPARTVQSIKTKALRTGRKVTGEHRTNRDARWTLMPTHPQYGTEVDCKIIFVKLAAQIFCFSNAPSPEENLRLTLEENYLGSEIRSGTFRDSLLLERFDFNALIQEGLNPIHGHSSFHMGHEDPTRQPRHTPDNVAWRTLRSNLIQGDMTLRQARIYFIKLIGRYFELGEINIV